MNKRPRVDSYVRHTDGRIGRVIAGYPQEWGRALIQFLPFGKNRHKHRVEVVIVDLHPINAMEVIAEASK